MRTAWRVLNGAMSALFLFAVVVQHNDPDPLRWMAIYGAACAACIAAAIDRSPRGTLAVAFAAAALAFGWALVAWPPRTAPFATLFDQFEMKDAVVEETREVFGLLIVGSWCAAIACAHIVLRKRS